MCKNDPNCLNSNRAFRSIEENREYDRIRNKTEERRQYQKDLYQKYKESFYQRQKIYRQNNKEKIQQRRGEVCMCECGSQYTHDHKLRHERTKKHINYIHNLREEAQTV